MANDAVVLLLYARQESWHILYRYERNVEAVAETNKASSLVRRINIKRTGEVVWLVSHEAHRASCHTTEAYHDVLSPLRLYLKEILLVAYRLYDIVYVIRHVRIYRHYVVKFVTHTVYLVCDRQHRCIFHII